MATIQFPNIQVSGITTTGGLFLSSAPIINTSDTQVLMYSTINPGRIEQRIDAVFLNDTQTLTNKTISASNNTLTGVIQTVSSAAGVTAPVYASGPSTSTSAVFNGLAGDGVNTTVLLAPIPTGGNIVIELTGNVVTLNDTQTLTNKTISASNNTLQGVIQTISSASGVAAPVYAAGPSTSTSAVFNGITGDGVNTIVSLAPPVTGGNITIALTGNVVTTGGTQTLTNKLLKDDTNFFVDDTDTSIRIGFDVSGGTTSTTMTLASAQTANRTITFPDTTDTVVTLNANQNLTNKTITAPIIIAGTSPGLIIDSGIDNTKQLIIVPGGTTSTSTTLLFLQTANRVVNFPDAGGNVVLDSATQTLTNKTIDSSTNTLTITNSPLSATNVNSLINQDIRTTSSPSFVTVTTTGTTMSFLNSYVGLNTWTISTSSNTASTVLTVAIASGHAILIESRAVVYDSTNNTSGIFKLTSRVTNVSGTVTVNGNLESLSNVGTGFTTDALTYLASGANVLVQYAGTTGNTHVVQGTTWVYYE